MQAHAKRTCLGLHSPSAFWSAECSCPIWSNFMFACMHFYGSLSSALASEGDGELRGRQQEWLALLPKLCAWHVLLIKRRIDLTNFMGW
jgi:hypothetical protein